MADEDVEKKVEVVIKKDRKETLEKLADELKGLIAKQSELDAKIKDADEITSKFPLKVAGPDLKKLDESFQDIETQIRKIRTVQKQYEIYDIPKSQECCPDVCASIKKLRDAAHDELENLDFYRDDMKAALDRLGIKTYKGSRTQKQEDYINERINELTDLMKVLEINKICKCE
ncbi:MAG: hypothetical protein O8C67_04885 [Candidatus Methanoperedens sp.]|nr:hypothetical protein [Candidatus Methanoperedens sp.]